RAGRVPAPHAGEHAGAGIHGPAGRRRHLDRRRDGAHAQGPGLRADRTAGLLACQCAGRPALSRSPSDFAQLALIVTGARPEKPSWLAAAGVRSMTRPAMKGPRSLMRTVT